MSTMGLNPDLLAQQASDTRDLVRFKQEMDGLKARLSSRSDSKEKDLREACQNFEAVFISKLWQGMKSTVPKEGYLHSKQEDQYMSMFDKDFAETMSRAGGIGLADMIYDQLSQKLKETSREALSGGVEIKPIHSEPIALKEPEPIPLNTKKPMTLEEWGGSAADLPKADIVRDEQVVSEADARQGASVVIEDAEVKAQLDALARRLEAQRMKAQLLGNVVGKEPATDNEAEREVGRKLAQIG